MSVASLVGFLVFITWQFSNVYGCLPDNASCFFDFECCSGDCSFRYTGAGSMFVCDATLTTAGSTHTQDLTTEYSTSSTMIPLTPPPPTTPPPSTTPHRLTSPTSYTTQSTSNSWRYPTVFTTDSNDYSTMPSIETTLPTPSRSTTPPTPPTPSLPPTLSTKDINHYYTGSSTEVTQPLPDTLSKNECSIPGHRCTESTKCCLWTCQIFGYDEISKEGFGVCPIPLVPWPPFDIDAFPWNALQNDDKVPVGNIY